MYLQLLGKFFYLLVLILGVAATGAGMLLLLTGLVDYVRTRRLQRFGHAALFLLAGLIALHFFPLYFRHLLH